MPAQIILEIIDGSLKGQEFIFDNIITILVGRNDDCYLKLPNDDTTVSRYHCLLDINPLSSPPQIQIRDYGSYTGTYVNDHKIGQRSTDQTPTENTSNDYPFYPLKTGDQIRLGKTRIQVSIEILSDAHPYDPAQVMISSTSTAHLDSPPEIPGYIISQKLGQGGFGVVYLANDESTQQLVALKVLRPHQQADSNARKKFLRELEISQYFNHPHIVRVLNAGESEDLLFLALEFCPCGTVNNLLKKHGGRLPIDTALHIIHQTLDGLEYAHNLELSHQLSDGTTKQVKGIVHRDLKPSNILCLSETDKPTIKIADFGLAKIFDLAGLSGYTPDNSNSEKPSVGGTYAFMPRQQVLDFKYSKPEVDIWSAAACLYQMLTGRLPRNFASSQGSSSDLWKIVLETPTLPIRQYNIQIPSKLAEAIDLALRDKLNLHFKNVAEFRQALSQAYE